jgi:hypothetical protein
MVAVVAPYINAAISKTVNVAADHAFDEFRSCTGMLGIRAAGLGYLLLK